MADESKGFFSDMQEMPDDDGQTADERVQQGALVVLDGEEGGYADDGDDQSHPLPDKFDSNLAEMIEPQDQIALGQKLREYYDIDIEARSEWERKMLQGMEIIGIDDVPTDRTAFDGASQVNHPALAEAMVQFQARAVEELLPPEGPVKCTVFGKWTQEKEEQRERVEEYMNYQLTEEDDHYYWDTDQLLFYLPYAGSAFKKIAISPITGTTRSRFIRATDFVVPYSATSLADAPRYTHRYSMSKNTFLRSVQNGYFLDVELPEGGALTTEADEHRELQDKSDDRTQTFHLDDCMYTFCETHIEWEFDWETFGKGEDGKKVKFKLPYVITWEYESGQVVRVQRLWDEDDEKFKKEIWFVHYKYLPGLGFYGFGLLHIVGSLGRAASGALRAVLDGSMTASLQGGFKSRDARIAGDFVFQPGVWQDVDMTAEELSKSFYTPPFKEPSPALFKTLEILINGIQRFASTTEAMVGDASNTGPVGTTVALIEQGSKVLSGIHKRLHLAQRQEFKLIAYSNYRYMEIEEYPYDRGDEEKRIFRADFDKRVDISPVSDPNIFSSVQRIAIAQALVQVVAENPDVYNKKAKVKAHKAFLKALKVPDADSYLPDELEQRTDPITENQGFWSGVAAKAYAEQDHASHIQLHMNQLQELQGVQLDPGKLQQIMLTIQAHIAEHFGWSYRLRISAELQAKTGIPLPMIDPTDPEAYEEMPIDVENAVAQAVAQFVAPPPPPAPAEAESEDMLAQRKADREDMLAQRKIQRDDAEHTAKLKREGLIDDSDLQEGV